MSDNQMIPEAAAITSAADLDKLPRHSIVASIGSALNVPIIAVWQRGSIDGYREGWCMPDTKGEISSSDVFYFLTINELLPELTVLWQPAS